MPRRSPRDSPTAASSISARFERFAALFLVKVLVSQQHLIEIFRDFDRLIVEVVEEGTPTSQGVEQCGENLPQTNRHPTFISMRAERVPFHGPLVNHRHSLALEVPFGERTADSRC